MKITLYKIQAIAFSVLLVGAISSCTTRQQPHTETHTFTKSSVSDDTYALIDSILQKGLDREALYTLVSDIKPISSLSTFSYPIANTDSTAYITGKAFDISNNQKHLDKIKRLQDAMNQLNIPDLKFFILPYKSASKNQRTMQIYVARKSAVDRMLNEHKTFFGQFGWVEGINPEILITANEYGEKYDRYRGFGYMFGYPQHAVDFYINAELTNEKKKEFVKRKFFQIPVYERTNGYFVYAYPEDYTSKTEVDSALYNKSVEVLNKYKTIRKNYQNKSGSLQALKLILSENTKK